MLNSLWGNIQGGKGRVYHKQQKGKKFVASLTNLLGPTTLIRSLGARERTLSVFRHRLRHFNQSFLRDQPTSGNFLGQFKDKRRGRPHIVDFVSFGQKNYRYKTCASKLVATVKERPKQNYQVTKEKSSTNAETAKNYAEIQVIKSF